MPPPRDDVSDDVGATRNRTPDGEYELTYALARSFCLLAAAAAGVPAYDTVDTEFRDAAAVERRARDSRRQGFAGKLAIRPCYINPRTTLAEVDALARSVRELGDELTGADR